MIMMKMLKRNNPKRKLNGNRFSFLFFAIVLNACNNNSHILCELKIDNKIVKDKKVEEFDGFSFSHVKTNVYNLNFGRKFSDFDCTIFIEGDSVVKAKFNNYKNINTLFQKNMSCLETDTVCLSSKSSDKMIITRQIPVLDFSNLHSVILEKNNNDSFIKITIYYKFDKGIICLIGENTMSKTVVGFYPNVAYNKFCINRYMFDI